MPSLYPVPAAFAAKAHIDRNAYKELHKQALANPDAFWAEQAGRLDWLAPWKKVKDVSFERPVHISWFEGGQLNVSANCIDRHAKATPERTAIIWEPDDPQDAPRHISYRDLQDEVCRLANVLKAQGISKGDRVVIYMPMIPEAAYAMLACARIGAVHSVVFGGFSPDALRSRIIDCGAKMVITADEGRRGGKTVPLKANTDQALAEPGHPVENMLVFPHTGADVTMQAGRDLDARTLMKNADRWCEPESMDAEDPLFILYTSGSTGKPKGVLHTSGGYLVYASLTHAWIFDYRPEDIYWCTADVGWITGHSYIIYGPLANGATTLMFEGVPTWPDAGRFWEVVDRHQVSIFYTAPTAIRALEQRGDDFVTRSSRTSLRLLGTVGEPINPDAWEWYHRVVGEGRCPIVDTWWQTETGGILITPLPGATDLKPGAAMQPFPGIRPVLLDADHKELEGEAEGHLCFRESWPGQMRSVYGDHARFEETYFAQHPGYYFSGDGARRDADGDYRITGRVDDVLNVSGHRLGTAELEAAFNAHEAVIETAVVGAPHAIKGEAIHAFVILAEGTAPSEALRKELHAWIRARIGPFAAPETIHFTPGLPKTRSGKIMRRILRKLAAGETGDLGDTSTLVNPEIIPALLAEAA